MFNCIILPHVSKNRARTIFPHRVAPFAVLLVRHPVPQIIWCHNLQALPLICKCHIDPSGETRRLPHRRPYLEQANVCNLSDATVKKKPPTFIAEAVPLSFVRTLDCAELPGTVWDKPPPFYNLKLTERNALFRAELWQGGRHWRRHILKLCKISVSINGTTP